MAIEAAATESLLVPDESPPPLPLHEAITMSLTNLPPSRPSPPPPLHGAAPMVVDSLARYRSYSPLTVHAYGTDLQRFASFLQRRLGRLPALHEIDRQMIVQFAV